MIDKLKKKKRGFTLLELLVSVTIFAITIMVGVDLFFTIVKIQRRISYVQELQGDARNLLEEMAREVRLGSIDYEYYTDKAINFSDLRDASTDNNKILVIKDPDDNRSFFKRVDAGTTLVKNPSRNRFVIKICYIDARSDSEDKCDQESNWEIATPEGFHVEKFLIFVNPEVNPFELNESYEYDFDEQPRVTIILQTESDRKEKAYQIFSRLQTTVSSRLYLR
ncbi:MAG: prepilin-type N-terminal cleavage/methylation domain-containing protein [Candidatus Bathyarchaeota archaeon]|nr:prepilin-type N-terminal cleavage/methylation domain-containing protein [Candidatus Bathyarchaeota archaeon]